MMGRLAVFDFAVMSTVTRGIGLSTPPIRDTDVIHLANHPSG
jgi:hypothetical protein